MPRIRSRNVLLLACGLLAGAAAARAQFEGTADFKIVTGRAKDSVTATGKLFATKTAYRMEWEADLSRYGKDKAASGSQPPQKIRTALFGTVAEPDKMYMIDDAHRTYSVWDLKKMRSENSDLPKQTYTVQKLGTDTVAGIACQKAQLTSSNGNVIDVCVAKEFSVSSDWLAALGRRQKENTTWVGALRENGLIGFPVRYAMRAKGQTEPFVTMQVTRVERGPVSAALFEVPAGYKETDFAMGGLSPEQQKAVSDARARMREALDRMTPEQRKAYEDAMKRYAVATPTPAP
jgi:hypothetical protein